jgi:thiol:disulfide interchange protein DsbG
VNRRNLHLAALAALAIGLAGCNDAPPGGKSAPAAATAVSVEAIAAEAQGFNVGSTMSARTVYVFFDPQCPHCAVLWQSAKPLRSQARFVWIPVAMLNDKSAPQGATLLAAPDPVAAMDQHEVSLREKRGGISYDAAAEGRKDAVKRNTALLTRFGINGVPAVVAKHATTGELVTIEGSMPTAALAQRLGLQAP